MAVSLSEAQRAQVLDYLGANSLSSDRDPRTYGNATPFVLTDAVLILEQNMRSIDTTAKKTRIEDLLDKIEASRTLIQEQANKLLLVSKVDGAATINPKMMRQLWEQDYILVRDLANKLSCRIIWHPHTHSSGYGTRVCG